MSNGQEHVTTGEFSRTMNALRDTIQDGFDGLNRRLDGVYKTQAHQGERIAALDERTTNANRRAGAFGAGWGAAVAAMIAGLFQWLSGRHGG